MEKIPTGMQAKMNGQLLHPGVSFPSAVPKASRRKRHLETLAALGRRVDADASGLDRFARFLNRRELAALRRALGDGERVLHALEATHGRKGLLAATDRRLLFVAGGLLRRKRAWPYGDVVSLRVSKAVDEAALTMTLRAGEAVFTGCRKREAEAFARAVKERPPPPDAPLDFTPPHLKPKDPLQVRREQLDRMLRKGSITKAEHERMVRALDSD
jgi:hypothetical protein